MRWSEFVSISGTAAGVHAHKGGLNKLPKDYRKRVMSTYYKIVARPVGTSLNLYWHELIPSIASLRANQIVCRPSQVGCAARPKADHALPNEQESLRGKPTVARRLICLLGFYKAQTHNALIVLSSWLMIGPINNRFMLDRLWKRS